VWSEGQSGITGKVSLGKLQGGSVFARKKAACMSIGGLSSQSAGPGAEKNGSLVRLVVEITVGDI